MTKIITAQVAVMKLVMNMKIPELPSIRNQSEATQPTKDLK